MKLVSKVLIGIFALVCLVDLIFTSKALSSGYLELHTLSGFQYGFWFAAMLKLFEIIIILAFAWFSEITIDDRIGIPVSPAIVLTLICFALAGASTTFYVIPGLLS